MPTLIQINATPNAGSTGRIAEGIGQLAIKYGWKSYIAYGRRMTNSQSEIIRIGNKWNIYWHILMTRLFDRHGLASKQATKKFIRQIRQIQPDIIQLHNIHGYYLNYPILFDFLKEYAGPVVWTLHDCWAFTGHCAYFTLAKCNKWVIKCGVCQQKCTYPKSFFFDNSKNNFQLKKKYFADIDNLTIIVPSQWLADLVSQSFLKKYIIKVINNGIDTDVFLPQNNLETIREKYTISEKFIILGVASVWSKRKGLDDFILLNNQLDANKYQIVLVGLNKQQISNLPKQIIGIARTENIAELAKLYSIADVFVNATYEDNFPTTNLESLACGTPVITYRTGGSVESVSEDAGVIIEQCNITQLLSAIQEIAQKGKLFYSEKCRQRALALYNKEDRFREYLDLYEKALKLNSI
ncbi:MAG: glycosyltransferase [Bacteroidales bacterium]|jgi:glycosyltransferase involved in cell wall biosynthesis|nr:glycosyltransferase [Bacteroidales bacterium]